MGRNPAAEKKYIAREINEFDGEVVDTVEFENKEAAEAVADTFKMQERRTGDVQEVVPTLDATTLLSEEQELAVAYRSAFLAHSYADIAADLDVSAGTVGKVVRAYHNFAGTELEERILDMFADKDEWGVRQVSMDIDGDGESEYVDNLRYNAKLDREKLIGAADFSEGERLKIDGNPRGDTRNVPNGYQAVVVDVEETPRSNDPGVVILRVVEAPEKDPRINAGDKLTVYEGNQYSHAYIETIKLDGTGEVMSFYGFRRLGSAEEPEQKPDVRTDGGEVKSNTRRTRQDLRALIQHCRHEAELSDSRLSRLEAHGWLRIELKHNDPTLEGGDLAACCGALRDSDLLQHALDTHGLTAVLSIAQACSKDTVVELFHRQAVVENLLSELPPGYQADVDRVQVRHEAPRRHTVEVRLHVPRPALLRDLARVLSGEASLCLERVPDERTANGKSNRKATVKSQGPATPAFR